MVQQISQGGTKPSVTTGQPIVKKPVVQKVVAKQPVVKPTVQGQGMPAENGSIWSKWWMWVIIAVVVIGIGVGSYLIFKS